MTQPPAGWYPDPSPQQPGQQQQMRYWNGHAWTAHIQPAAPQQSPQAPAPYAGQYGGQPSAPPAAPPYAGQYGNQYGGQYGGQPAAPQYAGPTTPDGVPLSGWWRRAGAFLIDSILVSIVGSFFTIPAQMQMQEELLDLAQRLENETTANPDAVPDFGAYFSDYMDILGPVLVWSGLVSFVLWVLYSGLMLRFKGATLGKMALGIAVRLRERPGQLPWSAIAARTLVQFGLYLTAFVPYLYLALVWWPALDVLWAAWDSKKQAIHDKAAKTNVVRVR